MMPMNSLRIYHEFFNRVILRYLPQIINEDLQDLLVSSKKDSLNIREDNGEIKVVKLLKTFLKMSCNRFDTNQPVQPRRLPEA